MGVLSQLGYEYPASGGARTAVQGMVASKPGAWVAQRLLHRLDRWVLRASSGRSTLTSLLSGLPVLMVTTTGAKSGRPRTVPLLGVPHGDDVAIVGSNFGQAPTPGWVHNLLAHPSAELSYRGESVNAAVRLAAPDEVDRVFEAAAKVYSGYGKYRDRVTHRQIKVFILEPGQA